MRAGRVWGDHGCPGPVPRAPNQLGSCVNKALVVGLGPWAIPEMSSVGVDLALPWK